MHDKFFSKTYHNYLQASSEYLNYETGNYFE